MPPFDEVHDAMNDVPAEIPAAGVNATDAEVPDGVTVPIVGGAGTNVNADDAPDAGDSPAVFDAFTEHA